MEAKSKRTIYLIMFIAFAVVVLGAGTYAYLTNSQGVGDLLEANTTTAKQSTFSAYHDGDLAFNISATQMAQMAVSNKAIAEDNASLAVELTSTSDYEATRCTYDVVWVWDSADVYTQADTTLPLTGESGTIYDYEFSVKLNDGKERDLSEFTWSDDGKEAILIEDQIITSRSNTEKTIQEYEVVVRMYNIETAQRNLFDKAFKGHIEMKNYTCETDLTENVAESTQTMAYYLYNESSGTYESTTLDAITKTYGTVDEKLSHCEKSGKVNSELVSNIENDTCNVYLKVSRTSTIAPGANLAMAIEEQGELNSISPDNTWGIVSENGYRYEGDAPNNYVCFGSEDTTCPADNVYRIIGAFNVEYDGDGDGTAETTGYLAKVQKNTMYGGATMVYHSIDDNTTNSHYPNSEIYPILNTTWHDSLSSAYQTRIASVNWNLGAVQNTYTTPVGDFYSQERGTTLNKGVSEYEKVFKVGMMYPSDYGYAVLSGNCARTTALYSYNRTANCYGLNWMHDTTNIQWTMTARIFSPSSHAFYVYTNGHVYYNNVDYSLAVRPAFYLNASVKVTGGSGPSSDPYRISL